MSLSKDFRTLSEAYACGVLRPKVVTEQAPQAPDQRAAATGALDAFVDNAAKMGMIDAAKVAEAKKELKKFFDKYFVSQAAPAAGAAASATAAPAPAATTAAAPAPAAAPKA